MYTLGQGGRAVGMARIQGTTSQVPSAHHLPAGWVSGILEHKILWYAWAYPRITQDSSSFLKFYRRVFSQVFQESRHYLKTLLNNFLCTHTASITLSYCSCHTTVELHCTFLQQKLCYISAVGWHNSELKLMDFSICKILHSNSWLILDIEINEFIKVTKRSQGYSCSTLLCFF